MEELLLSPIPPNSKSLSPPNPLLHAIYPYSSRYIPMPDKQKSDSTHQTSSTHDTLFNQAKTRILTDYSHLTHYLAHLQHKFLQVNLNQLHFLSDKHRYFLTKFTKFLNQHTKLTQLVNNLDHLVLESQPVQEEIKSINFIQMISAQTDSKLQLLKTSVSKAEQQKTKNYTQIQDLKQTLNKLKTQYFAKKRQELRIQTQIQQKQQYAKEQQVENTMKKIRIQKKQKQSTQLKKQIELAKSQYSADRWTNAPKSFTRSNGFNTDMTLSQIQNINIQNEQYIKHLSQTCENYKAKKLEEKKRMNSKLVSQTDLEMLRQKSREKRRYRQSEDDDLLKNEEIIKQLTITNKLREEFKQKKGEQLLNMMVQKKKLGELLGVIEEVKREEGRVAVLERRKLNLERSQMYKKSTDVVVKVVGSGVE